MTVRASHMTANIVANVKIISTGFVTEAFQMVHQINHISLQSPAPSLPLLVRFLKFLTFPLELVQVLFRFHVIQALLENVFVAGCGRELTDLYRCIILSLW